MFCPRCGTAIVNETGICPNCSYASQTILAVDDATKKSMVFFGLKKFFSSPLYLIFILVNVIYVALFVSSLAFEGVGLYEIKTFENAFPDLTYHGYIRYVYYFLSAINVLYIITLIVRVISRFLIYNSATNEERESISDKAISLLKWTYFSSLVCNFLPMLVFIACMFTPIARVSIMQGKFDFLLFFEFGFQVVINALFTVLYVLWLNGIRNNAITGKSKTNSFVPWFVFIYSFQYLPVALSQSLNILNGQSLVHLTDVFVGVCYLFLAVIILKYRGMMSKIEGIK